MTLSPIPYPLSPSQKKIIVFESVHFTIKADKILQEKGYKYQIVNTPREISSECGMSIETDIENFEQIYLCLSKYGIVMQIHEV